MSRKQRSTSLPALAVNKVPQRCHFYLKGKCKWGNFCKFQHHVKYIEKPSQLTNIKCWPRIFTDQRELTGPQEKLKMLKEALRKEEIEGVFNSIRLKLVSNQDLVID